MGNEESKSCTRSSTSVGKAGTKVSVSVIALNLQSEF